MPGPIADSIRVATVDARIASLVLARHWREAGGWHDVAAYFAGLATVEDAVRRACDFLSDPACLSPLIDGFVAALAVDPFAEPPFRASRDAMRTGAILFEGDGVSISANVLRADTLAAAPPARRVIVPGRVSCTRYVRSGGARLLRWRTEPVAGDIDVANAAPVVAIDPLRLADGDIVVIDGRTDGQVMTDAVRDVVTITVAIRIGAAPVMREYDRASGCLLRVATRDEGAARAAMLLTLLRETGRSDARALFDAATRDDAFFLRWEAMREWLALDTLAALPRLRAMAADDPNGEVRAAAATTLAMVEARIAPHAAVQPAPVACPA